MVKPRQCLRHRYEPRPIGGTPPPQAVPAGTLPALHAFDGRYDIGNGLGIVFGVLTTQVYAQAVLSGRDERQSQIDTLLAGVGTMVSGLGGVAVGMFMRVHEPRIAPAQALPLFATHYFSPVMAGVMLGAILITVITCAGGLAPGIATMLTRDLTSSICVRIWATAKGC